MEKPTSSDRATVLKQAVNEVIRRRPNRRRLGVVSTNGTVRPAKAELRSCCRNIHWSTPGVGVRHLCTVRHIAELYHVPYQELLHAVWEREVENLRGEE